MKEVVQFTGAANDLLAYRGEWEEVAVLAEIVACRKKSRRIRSRMVDCTVPGDRIEIHVHAEF